MIANNVRKRRIECGLSQTKLACRVGIAASTLSALESDKLYAWPKLRKKLAEELVVPESVLFPEKAVAMQT